MKYGFQRADFHKTHSHSTIFVYFLYDIFSRFCKVIKKSTSKSHFRSNMAFTAQNLTILGLGKRKYVKVSYAEVKDSRRRNLFTPLRKVWLSPSRTAWNSRCCTNFCRNVCMIFHVTSTLCYFLAKKCYYITYMLRTLANFLYYYVVQMLKMACSNWKTSLSDLAYSKCNTRLCLTFDNFWSVKMFLTQIGALEILRIQIMATNFPLYNAKISQ